MTVSEFANWRVLAVLLLMFAVPAVHARDKTPYETAKLIDVRAYPTGSGAGRAQYSFCLAIQLQDISYIAHYVTWARSSYQPTNLIVGDPIEVKIKDDNLYFKTGMKPAPVSHGMSRDDVPSEAKAHITRRERITPNSNSITCALPVAVEH
jgi:hypothetical protein